MKKFMLISICLFKVACASTQSQSEIAERFKTFQNLDAAAKLKECEAISNEYPEDASGRYCVGFIAEESKKDSTTAKKYYTQAIATDPNFEQAYVSRGFILAGENQHIPAAQDFDKASQLNSKEPNHAFMAGWMYSMGQDWSAAIPKLKAYLDMAGNSNQEKFLTASVHETMARLNWFNIRMGKTKSKALQASILTEGLSPEENFCIKFENLSTYAVEIKKDADLAPAYEYLRKEIPKHPLCKLKSNLSKESKKSGRR